MSNNSNASSGGIGLSGAVFIVFLVLKLTENIGWSWWWVTSPLWIPAVIIVLVLILLGIYALVDGWIDSIRFNKELRK